MFDIIDYNCIIKNMTEFQIKKPKEKASITIRGKNINVQDFKKIIVLLKNNDWIFKIFWNFSHLDKNGNQIINSEELTDDQNDALVNYRLLKEDILNSQIKIVETELEKLTDDYDKLQLILKIARLKNIQNNVTE